MKYLFTFLLLQGTVLDKPKQSTKLVCKDNKCYQVKIYKAL